MVCWWKKGDAFVADKNSAYGMRYIEHIWLRVSNIDYTTVLHYNRDFTQMIELSCVRFDWTADHTGMQVNAVHSSIFLRVFAGWAAANTRFGKLVESSKEDGVHRHHRLSTEQRN